MARYYVCNSIFETSAPAHRSRGAVENNEAANFFDQPYLRATVFALEHATLLSSRVSWHRTLQFNHNVSDMTQSVKPLYTQGIMRQYSRVNCLTHDWRYLQGCSQINIWNRPALNQWGHSSPCVRGLPDEVKLVRNELKFLWPCDLVQDQQFLPWRLQTIKLKGRFQRGPPSKMIRSLFSIQLHSFKSYTMDLISYLQHVLLSSHVQAPTLSNSRMHNLIKEWSGAECVSTYRCFTWKCLGVLVLD